MPEKKEVRKLELCDIAPHAPFDLPVKILNHERDSVGIEESIMTGYYFLGDSLHITYKGGATGKSVSEFMPYLRSLDQLTQEITHNGETFIPMVELLRLKECNAFSKDPLLRSMGKDWQPEVVSCKSHFYETDNVNVHEVEYIVRTTNMGILIYSFSYDDRFDRFSLRDNSRDKPLGVGHQLQLFQKLDEWLFDTRGLIPSGLAIPIHNTK